MCLSYTLHSERERGGGGGQGGDCEGGENVDSREISDLMLW